MQTCKEHILKLLSSLEADFPTTRAFMEADEECVNNLASLEDNCTEDLLGLARFFMTQTKESEDNEYLFQVLVRALVMRRNDMVVNLITEALENENTNDKETYINYIESLNDVRSVPSLIKFVDSAIEGDEEYEEALVKAIDLLRFFRSKDAAHSILKGLNSSSDKVRAASVNFFREMNIKI